MKDWKLAVAIVALTAIAVVRVSLAQRHFSATHDEPAHIASGYEWLTGTYTLDPSHPPLARVIGALPLWLDANPARPQQGNFIDRANDLLYRGAYETNLGRARRGTLVFLAIAIAGVAILARRVFSRAIAVIAAALFATLPPILGHAGLVTTDMAVVSALPWALIALDVFLAKPTLLRGALLGVAIAFGVLAKFSFLVYFAPAALIILWSAGRFGRHITAWAVAVLVAFLAVWVGYRFQLQSASSVVGDGTWVFMKLLVPQTIAQRAANVPFPAVSLPIGLAMVRAHNESPTNVSFLLGEIGGPWREYFPIVLFYKTPIAFTILFAWGLFVLKGKRERALAIIALAILAAAMTSRINIGVRHVLPFYVPASIVAAVAVMKIWERASSLFSRAALAALLAWLFVGAALAHPDYLSWFNEAAGPEPSQIVVDSNLEWGQDGLRLARAVREMQIERLQILYATNIRLAEHGVNAEKLTFGPKQGWIAIGEAPLRFFHEPEMYGWLERYRPVRKVGKSIRLYYIE
ncbi:MAG TPA: glycosyltransferase family 39 protein [Thermoanaerobaculia bacterium]|jgi:4-amino-4-deoxy-L-arabinose transferase-like glycosyltransferase|nr:glycosyltransferase family 39 protein [Thermoanaerobaculia bacterium]